jgi:hypothetical protein
VHPVVGGGGDILVFDGFADTAIDDAFMFDPRCTVPNPMATFNFLYRYQAVVRQDQTTLGDACQLHDLTVGAHFSVLGVLSFVPRLDALGRHAVDLRGGQAIDVFASREGGHLLLRALVGREPRNDTPLDVRPVRAHEHPPFGGHERGPNQAS